MEIDIREFCKFGISKIWIIIISMLLFAVGGFIYIKLILTPMFVSSTTLILVSNDNNQNSTLLQSEVSLNKNLVTTYSEIVKSRTVLTKVIRKLNLDDSVTQLSNKISVNSIDNTEIIKIVVKDESAETARDIAKTISSVFKKEVKKIYNLTNVSVVDEAYVAEKPYNVSPLKQMVIFVSGGLLFGLVVVFLIFYFDTSIKSSNDIEEKLGLAVIGNVAMVTNSKKGDD